MGSASCDEERCGVGETWAGAFAPFTWTGLSEAQGLVSGRHWVFQLRPHMESQLEIKTWGHEPTDGM